jgi:flagellar hook assembly protein FlgD
MLCGLTVTDVDVTIVPESELRARPNPFRTGTSIQFTMPAQGRAELAVYDVRGRVVRSLWSGVLSEGPRTLAWDGRTSAARPAPAGVYWIRLVTEKGVASRGVTRVR